MRCDNCGKALKKIARRYEIAELDEAATEGQMADYFAAKESGDWGNWGYGEIEYHCENCYASHEIVMDNLNDLNALIKNWHIKAKEQGDYFSKYIFQYLSFIAHLKNNLFLGEIQDRKAIQSLKRETSLKDGYLRIVAKENLLKKSWDEVIKELKDNPLHNSSHDYDLPEIDPWWNCSANKPDSVTAKKKGVIHNTKDWENMIEFWVSVRNNLFHGGKDPNIRRDQFLVKYAYLTMSPFMEAQARGI